MIDESLAARLTEVREAFAESQRQMASARTALAALTVRTESPDGSVSLTLDSMGLVKDITFRDDSYQDLEPRQLSEKIKAVFTEAQGELRRSVLEMSPAAPWTGLSMEEMLDPALDLSKLMPESLLKSMFSTSFSRSEVKDRG